MVATQEIPLPDTIATVIFASLVALAILFTLAALLRDRGREDEGGRNSLSIFRSTRVLGRGIFRMESAGCPPSEAVPTASSPIRRRPS